MIRRALYQIAGVDRATIETCPATDRLWAAQLGLSLSLSFIVVLGVAFHATGYIVPNLIGRSLAAFVIALTVFMFDRALYQSDWFYQGFLWRSRPSAGDESSVPLPPRRFLRIAVRLAMSFGLAWVVAVFLELAIFSDSITDKLKRDHVTVNQPVYQKISQFEAQLNSEIEQKRSTLASLEALLRTDLNAALVSEPSESTAAEFERQIRSLDAQEVELRAGLRQIQDAIKTYAGDMNAEELGQRLNPTNSGRVGTGPRYQFAKRQREVYEEQRLAREKEIAQLQAKREDLRNTQARMTADDAARREQIQRRRDNLQAQVDLARSDLNRAEAARLGSIDDFRTKALAASDFQKQRDDPLARMTAYQELKRDPNDGQTITLLSWMTKFLVIFLEIVPIVAKLFFSPPSVYAAKIQAEVERERRRVERERRLSINEEEREERDDGETAPPVEEPIAARIRSVEFQQQKSAPTSSKPGRRGSSGTSPAVTPIAALDRSDRADVKPLPASRAEPIPYERAVDAATSHRIAERLERDAAESGNGQAAVGRSLDPELKQRLLKPLMSLEMPEDVQKS